MVELLSVHIPKTAGTAFLHILTDVYGINRVICDYPPDKIYQLNSKTASNIKVIHGHFLPLKYKGAYPEAKRIVWLRHPIFRLISEYFFAKIIKDRENAVHAQLLEKNLNIFEFAQIPKMRNFLSQHIQGLKLHEFDFVGIQEFYEEDLKDLQKMMNWRKIQPIIKNNNCYPQYQKSLQKILSDTILINQIARLNLEDLQLYQKALKLRAKRRQESSLIQATLAEFQRSQFILDRLQQEIDQAKLEAQQTHYWLGKQIPLSEEIDFIPAPNHELQNNILGFHFDSPIFPVSSTEKIITINGWVIGKNTVATKVIIRHHNEILAETPVNLSRPDVAQVYAIANDRESGFKIILGISAIPPQTKLTIEVILANREHIALGTLHTI